MYTTSETSQTYTVSVLLIQQQGAIEICKSASPVREVTPKRILHFSSSFIRPAEAVLTSMSLSVPTAVYCNTLQAAFILICIAVFIRASGKYTRDSTEYSITWLATSRSLYCTSRPLSFCFLFFFPHSIL